MANYKFSMAASQIPMAFMSGHISVALAPLSISFFQPCKFFPTVWSIWNSRVHFFYLFSDFIKGILSSSKYSMKLFKRPHDKVNHLPKCGRKVKVNCINGPIKNSPYGYKNPVNLPYQHSPYAPLLAQPWKPRGAGYSQGMGTQMPPWIQWI